MGSFLIHYTRIHSTRCHARTHKVRACFCKEKSLEIAQAECKMEIQEHKEFGGSGICFYPELEKKKKEKVAAVSHCGLKSLLTKA